MQLDVSVGKWRSRNLSLNLFDAKAWGLLTNLGGASGCKALENVTKAR